MTIPTSSTMRPTLILEVANEGADTLNASVTYVLAAGQSVETLRTTNAAATTAINLTGNDLANTIIGNAGNNVLVGGGAVDTLQGLTGNDAYFVDNALDVVIEAAAQGTDNVNASVSYTLAAGVQAETLRTTDAAGVTAINLIGNEINNFVTGNDGNNILIGGGGLDTMTGNGSNDSYFVDNAADVIVELAGEGIDNVNASVDYTLAAGVSSETLRTANAAGLDAIDLTGNEINNFVTGNAGSNILNGGLGNDTLTGNAGNDTFVFNTALNAATNVDTIADFVVVNDTIQLENAVFTGLAAGTLAATALRIGAAAARCRRPHHLRQHDRCAELRFRRQRRRRSDPVCHAGDRPRADQQRFRCGLKQGASTHHQRPMRLRPLSGLKRTRYAHSVFHRESDHEGGCEVALGECRHHAAGDLRRHVG